MTCQIIKSLAGTKINLSRNRFLILEILCKPVYIEANYVAYIARALHWMLRWQFRSSFR